MQNQQQRDALHEALKHRRRRYVLSHLRNTDRSQTLADLAEHVAERETDAPETVDREVVKDVYMSLYHRHVPKLADCGFVRYDQDEDRVTLLDRSAAPLEEMDPQ